MTSCPDYGDAESFYVFIVGHCEEWPENRVEQGDIALFDEYLAAGVPPSQICYIKDKECSKTNCQEKLEFFLKETRPNTTLIFYYGGHGQPTGFNTIYEKWTYRQVVSTIDNLFQGERCLFLLDCCASGNLARWLAPPFHVTKTYISVANTAPFVEASDDGDEWPLTYSWIRGMRANDGALPLERIIDFLTDRIALVLGDQATIFATAGIDCRGCDWLPRRRPGDISDSIEWAHLKYNIPKDAIVSSRWSTGSSVFYKHPGGSYKDASEYLPPGWFNATILACRRDKDIDICTVDLLVQCPLKGFTWKVEVLRKELMNDFYMAQMWMVPEQCEKAMCVLARSFKYLDFSIRPDIMVQVIDPDGTVKSGRVLDWRYFDFEAYLKSDDCNSEPPFGAHVPVHWSDSDNSTLLPVHEITEPNISFSPFLQSLDDTKGTEKEWARKAMLLSLETSGKTICNAKDAVGSRLVAFWPEDEVWYDAIPLDPNNISLKILATHVNFALKGCYCPLSYEDGDLQTSPIFYVDRRTCCLDLFKMRK